MMLTKGTPVEVTTSDHVSVNRLARGHEDSPLILGGTSFVTAVIPTQSASYDSTLDSYNRRYARHYINLGMFT